MIKAGLYDTGGKKLKDITLPSAVFGRPINPDLLSQAVRVYLSNQRQAGAMAKTRGQMTSMTTAKVWRQKGTGRARHGSRRAPIFVGGGKAHGPDGTQNYKLKFSKKMKQAALASALSAKAESGAVSVLAGGEKLPPKSREAVKLMAKIWPEKTSGLVVIEKQTANLFRAMKNLSAIQVKPITELSVYHVLAAKSLVFTQQALDIISERYKIVAGKARAFSRKGRISSTETDRGSEIIHEQRQKHSAKADKKQTGKRV